MSLGQIKSELQTLYTGRADVYGYIYATGDHGAEVKTEQKLLTGIPCRLSYDRKAANAQGTSSLVVQDITMFCDPEHDIPAGSKIVITQNGATRTYKCSSQPAVYASHQEVELTAYRERA